MTKKRPKFGAIPTLNMPQKSFEKVPTTPRPAKPVVKEHPAVDVSTVKRVCHKSFTEFCGRAGSLKSIKEWDICAKEDRMVLKKSAEPSLCLPQVELMVDDSLGFTIKVYGWLLPDDHILYTKYLRSMRNITLSDLVKELAESFVVCPGTEQRELHSNIVHHVIPMSVDPFDCSDNELENFSFKEYWRSRKCQLLVESDENCQCCKEQSYSMQRSSQAKQRRMSEPGHLYAPVSKTAPDRLKLTLREQRLKCADLER